MQAGATYQVPVYDSNYNVLYYETSTDGNEDTYGSARAPAAGWSALHIGSQGADCSPERSWACAAVSPRRHGGEWSFGRAVPHMVSFLLTR